jgi:hypothetical protein
VYPEKTTLNNVIILLNVNIEFQTIRTIEYYPRTLISDNALLIWITPLISDSALLIYITLSIRGKAPPVFSGVRVTR